MPNYCNNTVRITGKNSEIKRIEKAIKEDAFLQYLHPMPDVLKDTTADGTKRAELIKATGASDWYDWRIANWSTKWEVSRDYAEPEIEEMDEHEAILTWSFDSAWAPPIGAYDHYLENNSDMTIFATYYEPGCDFMGVWDSGDDRCYHPGDYKSDDDFWTTEDGELLDNNFGIVESKAEWEAEQETEAEIKVRELVVEKKAQNLDQLKIAEEIE